MLVTMGTGLWVPSKCLKFRSKFIGVGIIRLRTMMIYSNHAAKDLRGTFQIRTTLTTQSAAESGLVLTSSPHDQVLVSSNPGLVKDNT